MKSNNLPNAKITKRIERKTMKKAKKQWVIKGLLFSTVLSGNKKPT